MLALRSPQVLTRPSLRFLHSVPRIALSPKPLRSLSHAVSLSRTNPPRTHYLGSRSRQAPTAHTTRTLATTASGKSQGDLIIEEIQELSVSLLLSLICSQPPPKQNIYNPNQERHMQETNLKSGTATKPPKTNSKSQQTAPTAQPSTPPRTANLPAMPSTTS